MRKRPSYNEFNTPLDRNGYADSIMQDTESQCYWCGCYDQKLDRHEVFGGAYRQKSKALGLWVSLCHERCHLGGVHRYPGLARIIRGDAQKKAAEVYNWTEKEFIRRFGKNYLDEEI